MPLITVPATRKTVRETVPGCILGQFNVKIPLERIRYCNSMDIENIIAEIESLERIFTLADKRPLQMPDWKAANQKHDETYANNPWFRLWKQYGVWGATNRR